MRHLLRRMGRDQSGTTTIEFTIVVLLFFMLTFGITEFGYLLWQYNSAAKAAQLGARLAAISNPVWKNLVDVKDSGTPGDAWKKPYDVTCTGAGSGSCSGTLAGAGSNYDADAMKCLIFGRKANVTPPAVPCDDQCLENGTGGE